MTAATEILDLTTTLGAVEVPRDVVQVSGPDAVTYLQGQVSQSVEALAVGASSWTFVLQPTGKVDVWCRVTRTADDTFVLDVEAGAGEAVVGRLGRFLLRTKAEIVALDDWRCVVLLGPGATEAAATAEAEAKAKADADADADDAAVDAAVRIPAGWPGIEGAVLLGPDVTLPAGVAVATVEAVEAARITAGVPAMGTELTDRTIPAEAGQWVIDASVDFTKGCFTGQELVARIDSRGGNVPRHLRGLVVEGAEPPAPGSPVTVDGKQVGEVTSSAYSPALGAAVALAYVGRAVEPPAAAVVTTGAGDVPADVRLLPLVGPAVG